MRIISVVPSQTELLHYLGLDAEVVGITIFCIHPDEWFKTKTRVGGTKKLDLEKIRKEGGLKVDFSDSISMPALRADGVQSTWTVESVRGAIQLAAFLEVPIVIFGKKYQVKEVA